MTNSESALLGPVASLADLPSSTSTPPALRLDELKATGKLPSPKGIALEVVRLCQREDSTTTELARLIQADPAMCGRLIKAANVSALGVRRPVLAVQDAIVLLGLPSVRRLALGFSLISGYHQGECQGFDYRSFWSQAIASALAAEALATRLRLAIPDEAFVCGLLAQIGRLAFASVYPKRYAGIIDGLDPNDIEALRQRERAAFAADHIELTAGMLSDWGFPAALVGAIEAMYDIDQMALSGTLSRTGKISLMMQTAIEMGAMICGRLDATGLQRLQVLGRVIGLDDESIDLVLEHAQVDWKAWVRMLDIQPAATAPAVVRTPRVAQPALPRAVPGNASEDDIAEPAVKVLVIDESSNARTSIALLLIERGFVVESVAQPAEAFEKLIAFEPDIIIADWEANGRTRGIEFVTALRQSVVGDRVYMLILTADSEEQKLVQAFAAGVDDYVEKSTLRHVLPARLHAGVRYLRNNRERLRNMDNMKRFAAELVVNNRKLQAVALTDPLTGLPNRRYALERLEQELSKAHRAHTDVSCLRIDADQFNSYRKNLGDAHSDQLLRHLTKQIRARLRLSDTFCRVGEHEFLIICADTAQKEAFECAERLQATLEVAECLIDGQRLHLTISVGVAADTNHNSQANELFGEAERLLQLAQAQGINHIKCA